MKIIIDLDSTVADLMTPWLAAINEVHAGTYGELTIQDCRSWNVASLHPIGKEVYSYLNMPGLFLRLKPLEGAIEALRKSYENRDDHYVISDAVSSEAAYEKLRWTETYLPWIPSRKTHIINTQRAYTSKVEVARLIQPQLALEDAPHHIKDYREAIPTMDIACIGYEYNRHVANMCDLYIAPDVHEYQFARAWNMIDDHINKLRMLP